jgi:hypothetical protein
LEKIACGDFFETLHGCRPQKAGFLRPARPEIQRDFFETLHGCRRLRAPHKKRGFCGLLGLRFSAIFSRPYTIAGGYAPRTKSGVFAACSA